jgi:putative redox protein
MMETSERRVTLKRESKGIYVATNARGDTIRFGPGMDDGFSPVELLLAAVAGCSGIDVDYMTSRRAEPLAFDVDCTAVQERSDDGNILRDIVASFRLEFPEGDAGDGARERVGAALAYSREKGCTVSRTIAAGMPVRLVEA